MDLPRTTRARLERRLESVLESQRWDRATPASFGERVAEASVDELVLAGAALGRRTTSGLARALATAFRRCFDAVPAPEDRPAVDRAMAGTSSRVAHYVVVAVPAASDVADVVATWAKITWTGPASDDAAAAPSPIPSFEAALAAGGWRTILTDPSDVTGARARVLAMPAHYAPIVASAVGAPPRPIAALALLAQLGDDSAREELASRFGEADAVDAVLAVLEQAKRLKLPTPVPAARLVRELPRLHGRAAWRAAALCLRRGVDVPGAMLDAAADAVQPRAELADVDAALALLDAGARVAPDHGARAAEVVLREATRERSWLDVAAPAMRLLARCGGCADEASLLAALASTCRDTPLAALVEVRLDVLRASTAS